MAECKIVFQDGVYTQEQFIKALKKGLLYNLIDRKVIDMPQVNLNDIGTSIKGFEQHFVSSKADIKSSMMDVFGLPEKEATAVSEIYDRVAFAWASRHNSTREKFYKTLTVFKGDPAAISKLTDAFNQEHPLIREALSTGYIKDENTQKVARERFNIPKLKLLSSSGSDRDTYDLGNGTVLKVAKTARGLRQNMYEGMEGYSESRLLPEITERGLNYVVAEKVSPLDPVKHKWVYDTINKAEALNNKLAYTIKKGGDSAAVADELESLLISKGFGMYTEADILYGDFANPDNWGVAKDGSVMLSDAGTLAGRSLITDYEGKSNFEDEDFKNIYDRSADAYDKYKDLDENLYYQGRQSLANKISVAGTDISNVLDILNTPKNFLDTINKKGDFANFRKDLLNQIKQNIDITKEQIVDSKSKIITKDGDVSEIQQRILDKRQNKLDILQNAYDTIDNNLLSFDDIKVNDKVLNQDAQAAVRIKKDGTSIIYALSNPNISSPLHELAHVWESQLRPNETQDILDWAGQDEWTKETSEKFARGFEKYLADGNAPTPLIKQLFDQFKEWLTNIYNGIVGSSIDLELNDPMKAIYAKMLGENYKTITQQTLEAEKANPSDAGQRDMRPDTMERRKSEYVEPIVVNKQEEMQKKLDELNQSNKHLHPIPEGALDYYGRVSEIQAAMSNGTYVDALRDGTLDEEQLRSILHSVKWSTEDPEFSSKIAEKNLENILFKANDIGSTQSIDALIALSPTHPTFQNLANYFIKSGKLGEALNNNSITYEQAKIILDSTISQDTETRDIKDKLSKEVNEKVDKQKTTKKVIEKKIAKEEVVKEDIKEEVQKQEEPQQTPREDVTPEPEVITPQPEETKVTVTANGKDLGTIEQFEGVWYHGDEPVGLTREEAEATVKANAGIADETPTFTGTPTETTPVVPTETNSKYKVGDKVSAKGKNGIITEIDEDGYARLEDSEGGFVAFSNVNKLADPVEETTEAPKDDKLPIPEKLSVAEQEKKDSLERVAERMQKFLPSVNFEIGYFNGTWKGRIKEGKVQINLKNATLDTPIHEFMHPFILALRLSNYELYSNLIDELRYGQYAYYLDLVNEDPFYSNLQEHEREEEALVRFLAEDIQTVFNERGQIDQDALDVRKDSFLANVYKWFKELWDKLWGVEDKSAGAKKGTINAMTRVTYNKKKGILTGYKAGAMENTYSFKIKDINDKEELAKRNISDATMKEILDIANDDEADTSDISLEYLSTLKDKPKADPNGIALTTVTNIPVNIKLRDLSDFIIAQEKVGIDLSAQQTAIDQLEAYQQGVTDKEANEILDKVKKRLVGFADEAKRRVMNAQMLPTEANSVKRILQDYDGVEGVAEYVRQGMDGLNLAYKMVRYIQEDLKKTNLTSNDINSLNRDLAEVRSLIAFYGDVANLSNYVEDEFDKDEKKSFQRILAKAEVRKGSIVNIATDLQAHWLYPYLQDAQKNLPDANKLTFEQFKRNLRFVDRDASSVTYWLGASINSRDPLTAILAVALKDKLNEHHLEEIDKLNDIRTIFDRWQKRTGVKNTIGAIEDYYKQNYLRQAKVWETWHQPLTNNQNAKVGDKITSNGRQAVITEINNGVAKVSGYVERWAFHEKYLMDLYDDDLRKFTESLAKPSTTEEWDRYNDRVKAWVNANNPLVTGNTRYINPSFSRLSSDEYFQVLYNTYKEGNAKYGERQLLYGIVPQAYRPDSILDKGKNLLKGAKGVATALSQKDSYTIDNTINAAAGAANYIFDADGYMAAKDLNLDGSYYRGVKSPFTHLVDPERLDLRLNESVYGFYSAANTFSSLREVQANVENLKMLVEGNPLLRIQARSIAQVDKDGRTIFDRFLNRPQNKEGSDVKINRQLLEFVNDTFYGEDEFQANFKLANGKVNINMNKLGKNVGFMTALTNMAGNLFAGVSNVTVGNIMSFGEAVGGKYYNPKDWVKGAGIYMKSTPEFLADTTRPVKSKITQLGILYDAIQGEFRDKYGKNITGNILQKYAQGDTFFIINHVAEHQIQLTGMLALMNATKVKLQNGKEVSLFDAYEKNAKGFYKMRSDAIWTKEQDNQFSKTLHGISKDLNGNYAAFDKGTIQRHWWGKIALQYRKYLYPAWRSRFASERVDYERGEVIEGYYKTFLRKLGQDIKDYKFNIIGLLHNQGKGLLKNGAQGWTKEQQYAHRKTMFDLVIVGGTTFVAAALASMEAGDDDKDKWSKNALQLQALRLRSDMSQFNLTIIPEFVRQLKNPSASLNTLTSWGEFIQQLASPTEEYSQNSGYHEKGDSKLGARFEKVLPLYRQYLRHMKPEEMVKYYQLINKNVDKNNSTDNNQEANN